MKRLLLLVTLCACLAPAARAQSFCASDGQPMPVALVERFISADCPTCWSEPPALQVNTQAVIIDWIVPSPRGDEAPLSAAASRDALTRLAQLKQAVPAKTLVTNSPLASARTLPLRVAHGLAFNDYLGTSIEMKPAKTATAGPWTAWLLMLEAIPAGTEGSPMERRLARNLLKTEWTRPLAKDKDQPARFMESRPLSIPAGANPDNLSVLGWVEDTQGRIRSIALSRCTPAQ
ncbi:MAG: hypothetical protein Q8K22_16940 [Rhodoferax sp.]|nr:hypothetical protein [Rhodoferax sp.]